MIVLSFVSVQNALPTIASADYSFSQYEVVHVVWQSVYSANRMTNVQSGLDRYSCYSSSSSHMCCNYFLLPLTVNIIFKILRNILLCKVNYATGYLIMMHIRDHLKANYNVVDKCILKYCWLQQKSVYYLMLSFSASIYLSLT